MSDYIFKPPPPPPPKNTTAPAPAFTSHPFNRGGGRGGYSSQGHGGGGRGCHNAQQTRGGYGQQNRGGRGRGRGGGCRVDQQGVHLNPAFFPQFQQLAPSYPSPPPIFPQWPQPSTTNPFLPQWTPAAAAAPQSQPQHHPRQQLASQPAMPLLPPQPLRCYNDLSPPSAAAPLASYAHFPAPAALPGPAKKPPSRPARPDMTREEWLALNGGKLVGTDLRPPETDDEIAAWISERKKRWPSAKRVEEKEREDSERRQRAQMRWDAEEARRAEEKQSRLGEAGAEKAAIAGRPAKRKRDGDGNDGDNDGSGSSPEEISAHTRHAFRDDRRKAPPKPKAALCRQYASNRSCPRGTECPFVHDPDAGPSQSRKKAKRAENQRTKQEKSRPSLYQRLVEREMDRENEVVLQVIKYLVESDALNEGEEGGKGERMGCEQDGEEGGDEGDGEGDGDGDGEGDGNSDGEGGGDGDGDGDGEDEDEHAEAEGRVSQTQALGPAESGQELLDRIPEQHSSP